MVKRLKNNGMWESSRLMLPEHKEATIKQNADVLKRIKPIIYDDQWNTFLRIINESYHSELQIKITVFGDFEDVDYVGVVVRIDQLKGEIKLDNVRMLFSQIINVKTSNKAAKRVL